MCQEVLCHAVSAENLTARVLQFLKSSIGAKHGTAMAETAPSCVGLTLQCAEHCGVALQLTRTLQRSSQIYLHPPPPLTQPSVLLLSLVLRATSQQSYNRLHNTSRISDLFRGMAWGGAGGEGYGIRVHSSVGRLVCL